MPFKRQERGGYSPPLIFKNEEWKIEVALRAYFKISYSALPDRQLLLDVLSLLSLLLSVLFALLSRFTKGFTPSPII